MGEIWGCRHMVEARHGMQCAYSCVIVYAYHLHVGGLPCTCICGKYDSVPVCRNIQVFILMVFLVRKEHPPRSSKASHEM